MYDVEYLSKEEIIAMEPEINPEVKGGLWIPRESIIDPFLFVVAMAENAVANGARFLLSTEVTDIKMEEGKAVGAETTGENVRYVCPQKVEAKGDKVDLYFRVMAPVTRGQVLIADILGTGVDIVATGDAK